jgi:hypothetical protein
MIRDGYFAAEQAIISYLHRVGRCYMNPMTCSHMISDDDARIKDLSIVARYCLQPKTGAGFEVLADLHASHASDKRLWSDAETRGSQFTFEEPSTHGAGDARR